MKTNCRISLSQFALSTLALSLVAGCATTPKPPAEAPEAAPVRIDPNQPPPIDEVGLQRSLGLERPPKDLGYNEKAFNTCNAGYGYSSTHDCRTQNMVVIHFLLQCRDSDGTVSSTDHVLTPVASSDVKWTLGRNEGMTRTDGEGYGQIRWIAPASQRNQRLRLTVSKQFIVMRAKDMTRVVAPKAWCEKI